MIDTAVVNIAAHLPAMARRRPDALAVVCPSGRDRAGRVAYTHLTFRQLDQESDRLARGLTRAGIGRGVRSVLMVPPSLELFALVFALFKAGAVPVMVDPGMGIGNLGTCLGEARPHGFIGVTKAHLARTLLGWCRQTARVLVSVGTRIPGAGLSLDQVRSLGGASDGPAMLADTHADEVAAILFTSGSTGVPKGAVYTHGIFDAQVVLIRRAYGIEPGEIDLPTFPLFALFAPALGMTAIVPDMDPTRPGSVDPRKIFEAIEDFGVTNMFGSPALVRRVGEYARARGIRTTTLRRVISAGAPMPADALEAFTSMLPPGAQVHTPYGATESLPVSTIGSDEILGETRWRTEEGEGVCVGRPFDGMDVRVIGISDAPIPVWSDELELRSGEIGEICVSGPVVTRSYFERPEATALAKIACAGGGLFHRMGDVGYFDDQGRLWFCGRKSHRVIAPDRTYFTIPVEGVFNVHRAVLRTALVGVTRNGLTRPVLCVEARRKLTGKEQRRVIDELRQLGAARDETRAIGDFLFHPRFPVDIRHNAKIFREKLALWADRRLP